VSTLFATLAYRSSLGYGVVIDGMQQLGPELEPEPDLEQGASGVDCSGLSSGASSWYNQTYGYLRPAISDSAEPFDGCPRTVRRSQSLPRSHPHTLIRPKQRAATVDNRRVVRSALRALLAGGTNALRSAKVSALLAKVSPF
jgi:hypothetical protein